jgi:hypothetical protein
MNYMVLLNSGLIGIAYLTELFGGFYNSAERDITVYRLTGDYSIFFIVMLLFNFLIPQLLYIKRLRVSIPFTFLIALIVNVGMWIERFVIIVVSLSHDHLPSSWVLFMPTMFDVGVFIFSLGLFLLLFFSMARFIPIINMSEVKGMVRS